MRYRYAWLLPLLALLGAVGYWAQATGDRVTFAWDMPEGAVDIQGYRMYYQPLDGTAWVRLAETVGATPYEMRVTLIEGRHRYIVRAYDGSRESANSDTVVASGRVARALGLRLRGG